MVVLDSYIGMRPWTVLIDDSAELRNLVKAAQELRPLTFDKKFPKLKMLVLESMANAYEQMTNTIGAEKERNRAIVFTPHPLSVALRERAGCCRYQGALFFALAYEANLADHHFLEAGPVQPGFSTVFNRLFVIRKGKLEERVVSMFTESLKDKSLDYAQTNPRVYEEAFDHRQGQVFYSYHRSAGGRLVLTGTPNRRINLEELSAL